MHVRLARQILARAEGGDLIIRDLGIIFRKAITRRFGKTFRVAHFTLKLIYKLLKVQLKLHVYIGLIEEENPPHVILSI